MEQHSYTESSLRMSLSGLHYYNLIACICPQTDKAIWPYFHTWTKCKLFRPHTAQLPPLYHLQSQRHLLGVPVHLPTQEVIFQPCIRSLLGCTSSLAVSWQAFRNQINYVFENHGESLLGFIFLALASQWVYNLHHQATGWEFEWNDRKQYLALPKTMIFHNL